MPILLRCILSDVGLSDGIESEAKYIWFAIVWFIDMRRNILAASGFLQFSSVFAAEISTISTETYWRISNVLRRVEEPLL
mmetsp:Transcript_38630/g.83933  ORF Transcript_38630/g.83933 Transcript_38630/m.83933 type:complete len:80 (-) Transcript_38630:162-401(-)